MTSETLLPSWSLEDLPYDTPQGYETARAELEMLTQEIEKSRDTLSADMAVPDFLHLVHAQERLHELGARLGAYAYLKYAGNTQDPAALSLLGQVEDLLTSMENRNLFFGLWFKSLPDEAAASYIENAGELRYYLESVRRYKPYTLSEPEEKIINLKDLNGSQALVKVYEIITNAFAFKLEVDGQEQTLTRDGLSRFFHDPSPDLRSAAYTELYRVYGENKTALAQIYFSLVRDWQVESIQLRGYKSPISARNLGNNLPDEIVDTLLEVCRENRGLFQRYFKLKARLLGMEKLRRSDIYAPIAKSEKKISYEEAVPLVMDSFRKFSPEIEQAANQVLERSHLDADIRPGKRGGAFCYSVSPELVPWVLTNYIGRIGDVSTLAHELGHAVHSILAAGHSILTFHAPLPLAETASVFGEMLVTDRLLQEESDPAVQRDLLMTILDTAYATVQRQAYFSIFEKEAHARIAEGCTSDDLANHYAQNLSEQFGDAVEISEFFAWEWTAIPHIYNSPFYTYAYSFGQLLVLALYQQYLAEGENFVPRYMRLLALGGSASPQAILAEAGLDISSRAFWQGGFDVLQGRLEQLEKIIGEIK